MERAERSLPELEKEQGRLLNFVEKRRQLYDVIGTGQIKEGADITTDIKIGRVKGLVDTSKNRLEFHLTQVTEDLEQLREEERKEESIIKAEKYIDHVALFRVQVEELQRYSQHLNPATIQKHNQELTGLESLPDRDPELKMGLELREQRLKQTQEGEPIQPQEPVSSAEPQPAPVAPEPQVPTQPPQRERVDTDEDLVSPIHYHFEKEGRTLAIGDNEPVKLSEREFLVVDSLYEHLGQAVDSADLKIMLRNAGFDSLIGVTITDLEKKLRQRGFFLRIGRTKGAKWALGVIPSEPKEAEGGLAATGQARFTLISRDEIQTALEERKKSEVESKIIALDAIIDSPDSITIEEVIHLLGRDRFKSWPIARNGLIGLVNSLPQRVIDPEAKPEELALWNKIKQFTGKEVSREVVSTFNQWVETWFRNKRNGQLTEGGNGKLLGEQTEQEESQEPISPPESEEESPRPPETQQPLPTGAIVPATEEVAEKKSAGPRLTQIERRDPQVHQRINALLDEVAKASITEPLSVGKITYLFNRLKAKIITEYEEEKRYVSPNRGRGGHHPVFSQEEIVLMLYIKDFGNNLNSRLVKELKEIIDQEFAKRQPNQGK